MEFEEFMYSKLSPHMDFSSDAIHHPIWDENDISIEDRMIIIKDCGVFEICPIEWLKIELKLN